MLFLPFIGHAGICGGWMGSNDGGSSRVSIHTLDKFIF